MTIRSDPRLRRDNLCAHCHRPRPWARWNRYSGAQAIIDPFCSTTCCKHWHGLHVHEREPEDEP